MKGCQASIVFRPSSASFFYTGGIHAHRRGAFPVEFEWEGALEPPSGVFTRRAGLPRVSLQLSVEVETRFGLLRGLLPETERAGLSWVLE